MNKRYSEYPTDAAEKETNGGSMKNKDAREMGSAWDTDHSPAKISPKEVVDPNAGVPSLGSQTGAEGGH